MSRVDANGDVSTLVELNARFIEAFRRGSWELLRPILAPDFSYLDGASGDVWPMDHYIGELDGNPSPALEVDQVRVHVAGDVAVVSGRTSRSPRQSNRYVDTYARRDGLWLCIHACVWPLRVETPSPTKE